MGPDAVAGDNVAGSDCADPAAPENNVRENDTVSDVVAISGDNDTCRIQNPDTLRAGRSDGARRGPGGAAKEAGLGRTGRRPVDPARNQPSLLPCSESWTLSWTTLREHEQTKSYVNRTRDEISG